MRPVATFLLAKLEYDAVRHRLLCGAVHVIPDLHDRLEHSLQRHRQHADADRRWLLFDADLMHAPLQYVQHSSDGLRYGADADLPER